MNAEKIGYWTILTYSGEKTRRFISSFDAGKYANRVYGLGNWTLQWHQPARGDGSLGGKDEKR